MKNVELLLMDDVPKLGKVGNIVSVKPGFARNYLIPKKLATPATKANMKMLELQKKRIAQMEVERKEDFKKIAQELELSSCTIETKANEDGHLFGSVNYANISEAFSKMGFKIHPDNIKLEDSSLYPIKELGIYSVAIALHPEVSAKSKVWVVSEQEDN
jgi:large subunit ribosomal protein L9